MQDIAVGLIILLVGYVWLSLSSKKFLYPYIWFFVVYMIIYVVDIVVSTIFIARLAPSQYIWFVSSDTISEFSTYTVVIVFALILSVCIIYAIHKLSHKKWLQQSNTILITFFAILAMSGLAFSHTKQELYSYAKNVLVLQSQILFNPTSIHTNNAKTYQDYAITQAWQWQQKNIIVIFAESISAVDSLRAWGIYNKMPKLDKIQEDGITFTNFFAHGCTSDSAHVAFLEWTEPRQTFSKSGAYDRYKSYRWNLPDFFNTQGYDTAFFSTVSLSFLDQRSFLEKMGFQKLRGEEYFEDKPKYVFQSAPDQYLYDKVLDEIQQEDQPFFYAMQTISSHHPYDTPYGKTLDEALGYTDDALDDFYQQLKKSWYFEDGYLVIFSDHRKIAPLDKQEFEHYGRSAYNRGVATIIWPDIQPWQINSHPYQHIDFYHGLKLLVSQGKIQIPSITNDPFSKYRWRDRSVRYCQYADPRYYITEEDGQTHVREQSQNTQAKNYINSYEQRHNNTIQTAQDNIPQILTDNNITLVAHQWAPDGKYPANSIVAMRQAAQDGAKAVEFDVSWTTDGYHVVVHGPDMWSLQCKSIYKDNIYQYSFAELRADCTLSNGDAILTLSEMLEKLDGLFDTVIVDVKVYDPEQALKQWADIIDIIKQFDRHQNIYPIAYDQNLAQYLVDHANETTVGWDSFSFDLPRLQDSPISLYLIGTDLVTSENMPLIEKNTIPLVWYTVRSYEDMQTMLDAGIKTILVDSIANAIGYLEQYFSTDQ